MGVYFLIPKFTLKKISANLGFFFSEKVLKNIFHFFPRKNFGNLNFRLLVAAKYIDLIMQLFFIKLFISKIKSNLEKVLFSFFNRNVYRRFWRIDRYIFFQSIQYTVEPLYPNNSVAEHPLFSNTFSATPKCSDTGF